MRRAFTLIELLVVIGIIAVLAAILFPVFVQAKLSALQTQCMSNMRQIGYAMQMYIPDHDGHWPPGAQYSPLKGFASVQMWIGYDNYNFYRNDYFPGDDNRPATNAPRAGLIDCYLKSNGVKRCPVMPRTWQLCYAYNWFNVDTGSDYYNQNNNAKGNEYGPSDEIPCGDPYTPPCPHGYATMTGANEVNVQDPSDTLAMWEHNSYIPMCDFIQPYNWFERPPKVQRLEDHFHFLHRNGANTIWCDAHARRMTYFQLRRPMFSCRKDIFPSE